MAGPETNHVAGYHQISAWLRERIESGQLPPGAKVPGENELTSVFGVEQPTARRALDVLKNEGLIYARRGSGTYVREFRPIRRAVPGRPDTVAGRSVWQTFPDDHPAAQDVRVIEEVAPERVAHVLELPVSASVWVWRRTYFTADRPVHLATSYYPARPTESGHEPARFREEIRVRMPSIHEREKLELTQGVPVAEITRTAYTIDDRPVEISQLILDSSSYILEYTYTTS